MTAEVYVDLPHDQTLYVELPAGQKARVGDEVAVAVPVRGKGKEMRVGRIKRLRVKARGVKPIPVDYIIRDPFDKARALKREARTEKELMKHLEESRLAVMNEMRDLYEKHSTDEGKWDATVLNKMREKSKFFKEITAILAAGGKAFADNLEDVREDVFMSEWFKAGADLQHAMGPGIVVDLGTMEQAFAAAEVFLRDDYMGIPMMDRIKDMNSQAALRTREAITQSILRGEGIPQTARRISGYKSRDGIYHPGTFDVTRNRATMIARTEIMAAEQRAHLEHWDRHRDIIKGYEFVASLNERTCPVCGSMDGEKWERPSPGEDLEVPDDSTPPIHPRCRCTLAEYTYTYAELGMQEIPDRPSEPRQTWDDWLQDQPEEVQQGVLGPGKWDLWRSDKGIDLAKPLYALKGNGS